MKKILTSLLIVISIMFVNYNHTFAAMPRRVVSHSDWKTYDIYYKGFVTVYFQYRLTYIETTGETRVYKVRIVPVNYVGQDWGQSEVHSDPGINARVTNRLRIYGYVTNIYEQKRFLDSGYFDPSTI